MKNLISIIGTIVGLSLIYFGANGPLPPLPDIVIVEPDKDPSPLPGEGFYVLVVEQTEERFKLPQSQLSVLVSAKVREWLKANGAEARFWDADVDTTHEAEPFKSAIKLPRDSVPWVYIGHKGTGYSGPLPATVDEMIQLLEKHK